MPKSEKPIATLENYLPKGSFELVLNYLNYYKVELTVSQARRSILGNYRNAYGDKRHRISVNGNLNPFSFLITLIHELAHLLTYEKYGARVLSHGKEWQQCYSFLLNEFLKLSIFPTDITFELQRTAKSPAASCAGEVDLMKVLRRYDPQQEGVFLLEDIPDNSLFIVRGGRVFRKGELRRKRFVCQELASGNNYLISGIAEVKLYHSPS